MITITLHFPDDAPGVFEVLTAAMGGEPPPHADLLTPECVTRLYVIKLLRSVLNAAGVDHAFTDAMGVLNIEAVPVDFIDGLFPPDA
jgi:hypothetical protein